MSQPDLKYKRLEALFSEARPADPNPFTQPANGEVEILKARVTSLEAELEENQAKQQNQAISSEPIPNKESQASTRTHFSFASSPTRTDNTAETPHLTREKYHASISSRRSYASAQSRRFFGVRPKLVLAITLTTLLAVVALSYFAFIRASKTQAILGDKLQTTVSESTEADLFDRLDIETRDADSFLQKVVDDVGSSANYAAQLFNRQDLLSSSGYWKAEETLVKLEGGQMDNPNTDPASVFIPAGVPLTENLISELNAVMYLNLLDPSIFLSNSNMVAFYFIDPEGNTVYYPNIDLANIVPPDFDVTDQIFYSIGTPENNPDRKNIWTLPYQDPAGTGLIVTNVSPIYDQSGRFRGVVAADVQLAKIGDRISQIRIAQSGYAFLIDSAGHIIAMPSKGYESFGLSPEEVPVNETPKLSLLNHGSQQLQSVFERMTQGLTSLARVEIQGNDHYIAFAPLPSTGYSIGLVVPVSELNAPVVQINASVAEETKATIRYGVFLMMVVFLGAVLLGIGASRILSKPLEQLTQAAQQISAGNLDQTVSVTSSDEFGLLGTAFNNMTTQLRDLFGTMEQRVADRTHDLELASEVGRTIAEKVGNVSDMLTEATEMMRSRFNLYYTQVYLLDPTGRTLTLRAGTGDAGIELLRRGHHLAVGSGSLNGRAVSEKIPIIVADTTKSGTFLPNPLLPNTRSEMAVPLIVGGSVLGVLDMQSEIPDALNESNLPAFEVLAGQLSVAIQNAVLFAQSEETRKDIEANVRQAAETGWQEFLNGIDRSEKIGYSFNQTEVSPIEHVNGTQNANGLNAPINVTGAAVGTIQVLEEGRDWTSHEAEVVQATAEQLANHIEGLRLLAQAEKHRQEAEQVTRRLTREGWETYQQTRNEIATGFMYDLKDIKPLTEHSNGGNGAGLKTNLMVRNEVIGQIEVADLPTPSIEEADELLATVAARLSEHIETLRLSEELRKRAQELEELDRLKSSFLANMSHELRTPLNSILGFADVILEEVDGPLTPDMNNDLSLIQKNGRHLLHLINDVLDMAKIESGKMNLLPEKFKVHELFEEVTSITSPLANDKHLALIIDTDIDQSMEIFADRTRLRQVMINIVNNSIKFTEKGSVTLHAASQEEGGKVLIRVEDTGIGIPPDKLEGVFQEFTQVDTTTTRKTGGTGLGLPISRRLVEMHGGRIWAESTGIDDQGATFFVELPVEARITGIVEKQER